MSYGRFEKVGLLDNNNRKQNEVEMKAMRKEAEAWAKDQVKQQKAAAKTQKQNSNVIAQVNSAPEKKTNQTASQQTKQERAAGINSDIAFWTNPNGPFKFSFGFGQLPGSLSMPAVRLDSNKLRR